MDGRPRGADLIVNGDSAGGGHGGALAAAHALRLAQLFVKGRHHLQLAAPEGKVQNALSLQLLAHPHAVAAQDALVGVPEHRVAGVILLVPGLIVGETDMPHAKALGQLLQSAVAAFGTGSAGAVMGRQQQLQYHPPVPQQPGGVGPDLHAVPGLHGAGGVDLPGLYVLHDAHTARAVNGQVGVIAERGDVDTRLADDRQHVALAVKGHPLPVDDHNSLCHGSLLLNGVDRAEGARAPASAAVDALLVVNDVGHTGLP